MKIIGTDGVLQETEHFVVLDGGTAGFRDRPDIRNIHVAVKPGSVHDETVATLRLRDQCGDIPYETEYLEVIKARGKEVLSVRSTAPTAAIMEAINGDGLVKGPGVGYRIPTLAALENGCK